MKLSQQKAVDLNNALTELNKTVGKDMTTINNALAKIELPKNIMLDYSDYTNRWFYTTKGEKELDNNFQIVK